MGELQRVHATHPGTVFVVVLVSAPHAVNDRHALGHLALGREDLAAGGAAGVADPLELQRVEHVLEAPVPVAGNLGGVEQIEPGGHDDRADLDFFGGVDLIVHDRVGVANRLARAALAGLEAKARLLVDHRLVGHGLGKGHVDARPAHQSLVELRRDGPRRSQRDGRQIDTVRRADHLARPARHTEGRLPVVGGSDLLLRAPVRKIDRPHAHPLRTNPGTQPAKDAVLVLLGEAGIFDPQLLGHLPDGLDPRTARQEQLHHDAAGPPHPFRVGLHLQAFLGGIDARSLNLRAPREHDLHQAEATRAVGRQRLMVAERGNLDAHLLRGLEDHRSLGYFDRLAVNRQTDHIRADHSRTPLSSGRLASSATSFESLWYAN